MLYESIRSSRFGIRFWGVRGSLATSGPDFAHVGGNTSCVEVQLGDQLGESSTRLYYHVGVLEKVGLVRLVRTESRAGSVPKYYRAVARYVSMPLWLLHEELEGAPSREAAEWYAALIEHAAGDLRALFGQRPGEIDRETIFFTRNFVRLGPARAREFSRRLAEFQVDLLAADDEHGEARFAFTAAFVPVDWNGPEATRRPARLNDQGRSRAVHQDDAGRSGVAGP